MLVNIPVSMGELVDKRTILTIKLEKIHNKDKLKYIKQELNALNTIYDNSTTTSGLLMDVRGELNTLEQELLKTNRELWSIEDFKRNCEKLQKFDQDFIQAARQVYLKNDYRASIKQKINQLTNSTIQEMKSYSE